MKILILGASGSTGRHLVKQGLEQSHFITAFVRGSSDFTVSSSNLKMFEGDLSNYTSVEDAVRSQDAVVSALGASNPIKHDDALIKGVENIVKAMKNVNVSRLIYQSYLGVDEHRRELGFFVDKIFSFILKNAIADHAIKENIIANSPLDWTIVRCAKLTNGKPTTRYQTGERITGSSLIQTISRADVADFILKELMDNAYQKKKPRIMY